MRFESVSFGLIGRLPNEARGQRFGRRSTSAEQVNAGSDRVIALVVFPEIEQQWVVKDRPPVLQQRTDCTVGKPLERRAAHYETANIELDIVEGISLEFTH